MCTQMPSIQYSNYLIYAINEKNIKSELALYKIEQLYIKYSSWTQAENKRAIFFNANQMFKPYYMCVFVYSILFI